MSEVVTGSVKAGVSVLIFNKRNQILVGVRKGSHGAGLLSVPGGHLEFGESINNCCSRELMEEIGVCFDGQYKKVSFSEDFFNHNGVKKHYVTLYLAAEEVDSDTLSVQNLEPNKCEGWKWVSISELPTEMFCDTYNVIQNYLHDKAARKTS